ncbi:MAG: SH3 domain-containing protein [Clostridia bacterium]|nr:SH3 domain-containing protein [Clostridia bacterium]
MKKRLMILAVLTVLLLPPVLSARAGLELTVSGSGKDIYAYTKSGKQAGILYNSYSSYLSEDTNGMHRCILTSEYSVWVEVPVSKPDPYVTPIPASLRSEYEKTIPCDIFIAEVIRQDAPFYTSPDHSHLSAKHTPGTLVQVCGEFGNDYFVIYGRDLDHCGFMPISALRRVRDMTFPQYYYINSSEYWGLEVHEMTVYTGGAVLAVGASATGYSEMPPLCIEDGQKVTVMAELDGWVQLDDGYFMERRFLDPDGDHSVTYATVKTSGVLNRLRVHSGTFNDQVFLKLSSGTQVQVPAHTDEWASVFITGPGGGTSESGKVKMEFLAFGDASKVKNGSTRVRCTRELYGNSKYDVSPEKLWWKEFSLPAGTEMTVIGICTESDDGWERYFCLLDDGTAVTVEDCGGVLEPLEGPGVKVKTTSRVKMRMGPGKEAEEILTLNQGTGVEVLLRGENWTIVKYRDQVGYVMSKYLQFP